MKNLAFTFVDVSPPGGLTCAGYQNYGEVSLRCMLTCKHWCYIVRKPNQETKSRNLTKELNQET
jgi:hypothetical protein